MCACEEVQHTAYSSGGSTVPRRRRAPAWMAPTCWLWRRERERGSRRRELGLASASVRARARQGEETSDEPRRERSMVLGDKATAMRCRATASDCMGRRSSVGERRSGRSRVTAQGVGGGDGRHVIIARTTAGDERRLEFILRARRWSRCFVMS